MENINGYDIINAACESLHLAEEKARDGRLINAALYLGQTYAFLEIAYHACGYVESDALSDRISDLEDLLTSRK